MDETDVLDSSEKVEVDGVSFDQIHDLPDKRAGAQLVNDPKQDKFVAWILGGKDDGGRFLNTIAALESDLNTWTSTRDTVALENERAFFSAVLIPKLDFFPRCIISGKYKCG